MGPYLGLWQGMLAGSQPSKQLLLQCGRKGPSGHQIN
jgi:hypothetical protein